MIRLGSHVLIYAPGLVSWCRQIHADGSPLGVQIIRDTWGLSQEIAEGIADGSIPYAVDGEIVLVLEGFPTVLIEEETQ